MITRLLSLLICTTMVMRANAQVLPAEGAKLTYSQVMFDYQKVKGAYLYLVQVLEHDTGGSTSEYCSFEQSDSSTATMISDLEFGKKYEWRYAGIKEGALVEWHGPYHFEIIEDTLLKKNIMRVAVSKNETKENAGGLIVNDCTHSIVDRNGKLVWYLSNINWRLINPKKPGAVPPAQSTMGNAAPVKPKPASNKFEMRPLVYDLRLTPYGTITDIEDSMATERDLNGNIIWKAPNDGSVSGTDIEYYNHDFKRLANGHYMVLGDEMWRKLPERYDTASMKKKYGKIANIHGKDYGSTELGTIIEYDKQGKVLWSWKSEDYLDSNPLTTTVGAGDPDSGFQLKPHINAFSIDNDYRYVYGGFRDLSRVIKIDKGTGNVIDSWGERLPNGGGARHAVDIHGQHDAHILDDGSVVLFDNNNHPGLDSLPSVVIFSQKPVNGNYILWKYVINLEPNIRKLDRNGGNVDVLKNGNLLVCLGNLDRMFEITRDKKIVWQAEVKPNERRSFNYFHRLYRIHYISSLYPCYFAFETDADTVRRKAPAFNIRLFNKGSEKDSYIVKITTPSGSVHQQFSTDTIAPTRSATFAINAGKRLHRHEKIEVTISSVTNPDMERKRWVFVGRP